MKKVVLLVVTFWVGVVGAQHNTKTLVDSIELTKGKNYHQLAEKIFNENADTAVFYIRKATHHFKKSNDKEQYIYELIILSAVLQGIGYFVEYRDNALFTIQECEQLLGKSHPHYGSALNNLSTYHYDQGDFEKSAELLKRSLRISRENKVREGEMIKPMSNLANTLSRSGDYKEALEIREQIRAIYTKKPPKDLIKLVRLNSDIAWNYGLQGEPTVAAHYYQKSIDLIENQRELRTELSNKNGIIRAYQGAAETAIQQKKTADALQFIKMALQYQKEDQAFRKPKSIELKGDVYQLTGQNQKALREYHYAKVLAEKGSLIFKRSDRARKYQKIAKMFSVLQQRDSALVYYQQALQILGSTFRSDKLADNPDSDILISKKDALTTFQAKGQLLWESYLENSKETDLQNAYHSFQAGIQNIQALRQEVITPQAKNTLSEKTISIYEGAIRTAIALYEQSKETRWLEKAFLLAESNKSLLLLESFNEQAALGIEGLPDSLFQKDKELRLSITFYQKQLIEAVSKKEATSEQRIQDWKKQLFELKSELQMLTDHFEATYPRFYQLKYQKESPALGEWKQHLAKTDEALIEYFAGEDQLYGFVLWPNGLSYFTIPQKSTVFTLIQQLKASIIVVPEDNAVSENYQRFTTAAYGLYQSILAPALERLPASIRSLKIIPDDQLNYIPFELLLTEKAPKNPSFSPSQLQYAMEDYDLSYDYSATWLLKNEKKKNPKYSKFFIAFAPSFPKATDLVLTRSCQEGQLYQLECSEREVSRIKALIGGESWLNDQANKSTFAREVGDYRIIHMATHACADEDNPLFNKIFLTDDYLSNADLYNTNLNAELVVLSACNTGSGKLVKGEGVLSLARGFVQAGCASSIVSRWSVDDCATSEIMYLFYEGIESGMKKDEALKNAKLTYLNSADPLHAHPYYWSAFVAYGNMNAMDLNTTLWLYYLFGVGGLLLLAFFFLRKRG